jgi:RND family efflux transporter MFP subunit
MTVIQNRKQPQVSLEPPPVRWWKRLLRILVAVVIVLIAIAGATYLQKSVPKPQKRPPAKWVPVVETQPLRSTAHQVTVSAMGTVVPARVVVLESRVSGQVVSVSPDFVEGGFLKKGDGVIRLDEADYKLALAQSKSDLINAEFEMKLELGRQQVAQREWQLLGSDRKVKESELALRRPHLDKARADVASAKAAVQKATLDLERTRITAPFNAIVRSKSVDVGSQVSAQEPLAELVGTDVYWVQASVPVDRLDWIRIPRLAGQSGSSVKIVYAGGHSIQGTVIRLLGDLASEGRMARILIEVKDPLRLETDRPTEPPLLIGEYVRAEVDGRRLENVFVIPRTALRDGNTVWIMSDDRTLSIREVTPAWRDEQTVVLVDDLTAGDRLVVSDLPAPVGGMELQDKRQPPASDDVTEAGRNQEP